MSLRRVRYTGGEFVTSEAVAHAVLEYAAMLGNRGRAETVIVPAVGLADEDSSVELLLGPASQLTSEPTDSDAQAPDDREFLADLAQRLDGATSTPPSSVESDWDLEI